MILVNKQQFKKLMKVRALLDQAKGLLNEFPEELQYKFEELEFGDGLVACVDRGADCAVTVTEKVTVG